MIYESQKRAIKKWQSSHREHINEYTKSWRASHPEYKEKQSEYLRSHRLKKKLGEFAVLCSMEIF